MEFSAAEYVFRPLAKTDHDRAGIEELARGFLGSDDFILSAFDGWFDDPCLVLAFCLTNATGDLVALEVATLIGGMTIWLSALRVHADCRQRGVGHRMQSELIRTALVKWPDAQFVRYTTDCQNIGSAALGRKCGLDVLDLCGWVWLHEREELRQLQESLEQVLAAPLNPGVLVKGGEVVSALRDAQPYAESCLVLTWTAYALTGEGLPDDVTVRVWPGVIALSTKFVIPGSRGLSLFCTRDAPIDSEALFGALAGELRIAADEDVSSLMVHFPMEAKAAMHGHLSWQRSRGDGPKSGGAMVHVMLATGSREAVQSFLGTTCVG